jgi:hypothetical protein
MIAALKEAAEKAARLTTAGQSIDIVLSADGPAVFGRTETDLIGFTFMRPVPWWLLESDPSALAEAVTTVAEKLDRRRAQIVPIRVAPRDEKPVVRLITYGEWPLAIMSALAILIAIPLGGGVFP